MGGGDSRLPWAGLIAHEGRLTTDYRLIMSEALTWVLPLPITLPGATQDQLGMLVGAVEKIARTGQDIHGEGWVDDAYFDMGERLGCGIDVDIRQADIEGHNVTEDDWKAQYVIRHGVLRGLTVYRPNTLTPAWPDCYIQVAD